MSRWARGKGQRLLADFLDANPGKEDEATLDRLVGAITPIVESTIGAKLGGQRMAHQREDFQDIRGNALVALIDRFIHLKRGKRPQHLADLPAYARAVASSAFGAYLYERKPQWRRTMYRVRYILDGRSYARGFALWEDPKTGQSLCGYEAWMGRTQSGSAELASWHQSPDESRRQRFAREALDNSDPSEFDLEEFLAKVFDWVGGPLPLGTLVEMVVCLRGELRTEEIPEAELGLASETGPGSSPVESAQARDDVADAAEAGELLGWLWKEVLELPINQRKALLLSLGGGAALAAALVSHDLEGLATALDMSLDQLPDALRQDSSDRTIARHMRVSPRDVINLRKTARERLARRYQKAYVQMV